MSPRTKFLIAGSILLVLFQCMAKRTFAQTATTSTASTDAKLFGEIAILTNYVDKGLTQTDGAPAFQAGLGYQFGPQTRLGIWGSNVKYENNGEVNSNLRAYGAYKLLFTPNVNMDLRYAFSQYFKNGASRNTRLLNLDLDIFTYHVIHEKNDNWEGQEASSTYYGFRKEWNIPSYMILGAGIGYTQVDIESFHNYFDYLATIAYRYDTVTYTLGGTATSGSTDLGSQGHAAFFLSLSARF